MSETIRLITENERETAVRLSAFAFQYEVPPAELEERLARQKPDYVWGCFVDNELAAKMTLQPMELWLQGRKWSMGGIASVSTWPEYRRKGLVGKLIAHALQVLKEREMTVTCLHPFSVPFYRKYGWETYIEYKKYELETAQLPQLPEQPGRVVRTSDLSVIGPVYERYAAKYNGMLARDDDWWRDRVFRMKKGTTAVYYTLAREAAGYVIYDVKDYVMTIHELVWLDETARRALWKFIANHDSMMNKVRLQAPADDQLAFWLANPKFKQEIVPYFMARIVSVEQFVNQYRFAPAADAWSLTLDIRDAHAPWNDGRWRLSVAGDGAARAEKEADGGEREGRSEVQAADAPGAPAGEQAAARAVSCDIQTLTAMLFGYKRPTELVAIGRLTGTEEAVRLLEERVPRATTYLMDYY